MKMKNLITIISIALFAIPSAFSQGYKVGDKATGFKLKNTDGKIVSLSDYPNAKGFTVIFTCNHCPYAQAYQDRIIALDKKYKSKGYPVIAVNSNDPQVNAEDSFDKMVQRAKEKGYTFPYLLDETQDICRKYGATHTPTAYLLKKSGGDLILKYTGAIDDNYQDAAKVSTPYLANAIDALLEGGSPEPSSTKAIGCGIKLKETK
jgi:peroxiredoxin